MLGSDVSPIGPYCKAWWTQLKSLNSFYSCYASFAGTNVKEINEPIFRIWNGCLSKVARTARNLTNACISLFELLSISGFVRHLKVKRYDGRLRWHRSPLPELWIVCELWVLQLSLTVRSLKQMEVQWQNLDQLHTIELLSVRSYIYTDI